MFPPVNPESVVIDSTFDAWKKAPGTFSKRECYRASFLMAALVDRTDVTITHCHLDIHDRPKLVLEYLGAEHVTLFIDGGKDQTNVMIKAKSLEALAAGLELVSFCFEQPEAA